jgi:hypothetical protein
MWAGALAKEDCLGDVAASAGMQFDYLQRRCRDIIVLYMQRQLYDLNNPT